MADLNAILDSIKELKLLEVAELVKMMEDEFGVSAAAPVMVAGAAGAPAGKCGHFPPEQNPFQRSAVHDDLYTRVPCAQQPVHLSVQSGSGHGALRHAARAFPPVLAV